MSKIQTKINFLEKKKTSARLEERLKKNERKQNSKQLPEISESEDKCYDKENELKVKLLCRKNPTVLIYRSHIKSAVGKHIDKVKELEIKRSPLKREVISPSSIKKELNFDKSPLKQGTVSSREKQNQDLNLRSPVKRKGSSCLCDLSKENISSNLNKSPLKQGTASPREKQNQDLNLRSPVKRKGSSCLCDVAKEKICSNLNKSPLKQGTASPREKQNQDLNLRSPMKRKGGNFLCDVGKEDKCSNINKSPLKQGTASPREKQNQDLNLRSPVKRKGGDSLCDVAKENICSNINKSPLKRGAASPCKSRYKGDDASPPKQKCIEEETPSHLLNKLALESPGKHQGFKSRKELFPKGEFDEACKALHNSAPTKLPGREDKLEFIKEFLIKHSEEQSSGSLYISGPPGTGKTASVNVAISDPQISEAYKVICLNCTTITTCGSVYSRLVSELKLKVLGHSEKAALSAIEKHLESSKRKMILIILDELDQLCSTKQSVLYSVFEWPARRNARLVLIGIANALDLTDRVLPRLQAHLALQPTVLHFPSYTRQQIIDIIADRLTQAGVGTVFSSATLQLLAGKVAAVNGDVRRALDIARRVVEVAEKRTVLQPLSDNGSTKQTVALQEVLSVINDVYNTSQTLDSAETSSFPLQQKLLICSLLLIRQTSKAKDVTIGKLHEVYKKVCERRNLSALDMSEIISLVSLVEARGILRVTGKTRNRLSKVILQWDEGEVKNALRDKQLLAAVLMDKGVAF